jgi:hypothetical protein
MAHLATMVGKGIIRRRVQPLWPAAYHQRRASIAAMPAIIKATEDTSDWEHAMCQCNACEPNAAMIDGDEAELVTFPAD